MGKISIAVVIFLTSMLSLLLGMKANDEKVKTDLSFRFREYSEIYKAAQDSLIKSQEDYSLALDSLFYFHPGGNSFVACLYKSLNRKSFADEMSFVYGEKISGHWFFFKGNTYSLPRELFNETDSMPLSYSQFHSAALEDVFYPFALSGNFDFKNAPFLIRHTANSTESKGLLEEKF